MRKGVAGQTVSAQLISRTTGEALNSGDCDVYVKGDQAVQILGAGTVAPSGNGEWTYVPTAAETDYLHIAFTFVHELGVNVTVNVYTVGYDPTSTGAVQVTLTSAVLASGTVEILIGDDYAQAELRSLQWSAAWPYDLTDATIEFNVNLDVAPYTEQLSVAGSVPVPTGSPKVVRVELDSADTFYLTRGIFTYEVIATLATGNRVTLARGACWVRGEA